MVRDYTLFLILILAFVLRIVGIYPGYPDIHPDESTSYGTAVHLLYNFLKPDRFDYPAGVPIINDFFYIIFFIPLFLFKDLLLSFSIDPLIQFIFSPHNFFIQHKEAIFGNRGFYAMYWSRAITALFGAGSVIVLYLAGKKLFNRVVGLLAAFFLAVNYLHVVRSHFGLPDVYNGFFIMLILYVSLLILEKNTTKRYLLVGCLAGVAFSLKYQVFALVPFIVVHAILAFRKRNIWYFFHPKAFYAAFAFIATFLIINPYYLFNIEEAMRMNRQDILRYGVGQIAFRPYAYFYLFHWGIDRLPSIMVVLGMIIMLFKKPFQFLLITPYVLVFMFFMTVYSQGGVFTRNLSQTIPFFMLFAGYSTYIVFLILKKINSKFAGIIITIFLFWINLSPFRNSVILDISYSKPWNVHKLSRFLNDALPEKSKLRYYQLFITQLGGDALAKKQIVLRDWRYEIGPNSIAEFQEENTDFAILNTSTLQSITYWWRGYPQLYLGRANVPFDFIENDFYGLTIREFLNYTVLEAYKPWQSHHDNNYLVFKIPKNPVELGRRIAEYNFDKKEEMWTIKGQFEGFSEVRPSWFYNAGINASGAIVASSSGSSSRLVSKPIPVEAGKFYTAVGQIKTMPLVEGERDGFLRIDFYKDKSEPTLNRVGINVAISKRASASGEWESVRASLKAPNDAKFMTVSFQFKDAYYTSILDNVEVFESEEIPKEPFREVPIITPTVPKESLYYNTFI